MCELPIKPMNVYIGCGLTHVPREFFRQYTSYIHDLAASLRSTSNCRVRYALVDSDPQLAERPRAERAKWCYEWDRQLVEQADVIVADATFPSIGLGIELQLAQEKATPIILCFEKARQNRAEPVTYTNPDHRDHELQIGDGYVTLMALGLPSVVEVIPYNSHQGAIAAISEAVRSVAPGNT
jgi:hypothetical protein